MRSDSNPRSMCVHCYGARAVAHALDLKCLYGPTYFDVALCPCCSLAVEPSILYPTADNGGRAGTYCPRTSRHRAPT